MHAFMLPSTVTQNCTRGQQVEMGIMQRLLQHATCITDAHATSTHSISLLHVASGKPHRSLLTLEHPQSGHRALPKLYCPSNRYTSYVLISNCNGMGSRTMSRLDNVNDMQPKLSPLHTDIALSLLLQYNLGTVILCIAIVT